MNAEIRTEKIGTKWHAYLDGRPDIDQTALTEEAARRMVEQLRDPDSKDFPLRACPTGA